MLRAAEGEQLRSEGKERRKGLGGKKIGLMFLEKQWQEGLTGEWL